MRYKRFKRYRRPVRPQNMTSVGNALGRQNIKVQRQVSRGRW